MKLKMTLVLVLFVHLVACGQQSSEQPTDPVAKAPAATTEATPDKANDELLAVAAEFLPYSETKEGLIRGYFAYPDSMVEPMPAVLLIHDWWGLDDVVKDTAERLASEGYMVLAVDFFGNQTAATTQEAAALARALLEQTEAADQNLIAAHRFLTDVAGAPEVATMGWSMGGYWAIKSMRLVPGRISAAINFYGQIDDDPAVIATLDAPVLALFAGNDRSVTPEMARQFEDVASTAGIPVTVHIYPEASAGFANPEDSRYRAELAADAWQRTLEFLGEHLR